MLVIPHPEDEEALHRHRIGHRSSGDALRTGGVSRTGRVAARNDSGHMKGPVAEIQPLQQLVVRHSDGTLQDRVARGERPVHGKASRYSVDGQHKMALQAVKTFPAHHRCTENDLHALLVERHRGDPERRAHRGLIPQRVEHARNLADHHPGTVGRLRIKAQTIKDPHQEYNNLLHTIHFNRVTLTPKP